MSSPVAVGCVVGAPGELCVCGVVGELLLVPVWAKVIAVASSANKTRIAALRIGSPSDEPSQGEKLR
jgi:hypothetical protein